jgi:O-antigen/teichoic acid export membrane protein
MKPLETGYFKKLIKEEIGLVYTTLGGLSTSILGALFWFILASILNVSSYGLVNYYIALANIFAGIGTIGLNITVTTYLAKGETKLLYEANSLSLISGIAVALALSFLQWASAILSTALIFFSMTLAEMLGRKTYREYAFTSIGQKIAQITLSFILYFQIGIIGIILGYFLGSLLFSYKYLLSLRNFTFKFNNIKEKRNFTLHSYGYTLIGRNISNQLDKIIIGAIFGYYALGLYQLGFQFLMFLSIIPVSLQKYLLPEESSGNSKHQVKLIGLVLSTVASIALFALSPYVVTRFFTAFTDAIPIVSLMSISVIPSTITAILTATFLGNEKSKVVFTAGIIYITSLITSLIIMGTIMGVLGLAIAITTAKTIQAIHLILKRKTHPKSAKLF